MFGHMPELVIILVLALVFFGPEKLPEVASTVGKAVREVRQALDAATHPQDHEVPEDFSSYYYESLARSGEPMPEDEAYADDEYQEESTEPWPYADADSFHDDSRADGAVSHDQDVEHAEGADIFPDRAQLDTLVPDAVEEPMPSNEPAHHDIARPTTPSA